MDEIKAKVFYKAQTREINTQPSNLDPHLPTNNFNTRLGIYFYGSPQTD
jgi:hypothetical protein